MTVDWRVLVIALRLAAVTSMIFGMLPALQLSRTNHLQAMGSRGAGRSRREARTRMALGRRADGDGDGVAGRRRPARAQLS